MSNNLFEKSTGTMPILHFQFLLMICCTTIAVVVGYNNGRAVQQLQSPTLGDSGGDHTVF